MALCNACSMIDIHSLLREALQNDFESSQVPYQPSIWSPAEISQQQGCELCTLMKDVVEDHFKYLDRYRQPGTRSSKDEVASQPSGPGSLNVSVISTQSSKSELRLYWSGEESKTAIGSVNIAQDMDSPIDASEDVRAVLARNIDRNTGSSHSMAIARHWLRQCKETHELCAAAVASPRVLPRRLIDVGSPTQAPRVIETGDEVGRWVALSYCWGGDTSFVLTASSRSRFEAGVDMDEFPRTLRDAIHATRQLQVRYLWIDALCILQDSLSDWQNEAPKMKDIYSQAAVVIVAAGSDNVHAGIFQTRSVGTYVRLPWFANANKEQIGNLDSLKRSGPLEGSAEQILVRQHSQSTAENMAIYTSRWASRGWTTQEDYLATRMLIFTQFGLTWQCLSHAEAEDGKDVPLHDVDQDDFNFRDSRDYMSRYWKRALAAVIIPKGSFKQASLTIPNGWHNNPYAMWYLTTAEYSDRRLTKLSDRLPAFSGLARLFHQITGDEYCAGLWKNDIFRGLLWQYRAVRSERNKTLELFSIPFDELAAGASERIFDDHVKATGNGPSWSWISLEGWLEQKWTAGHAGAFGSGEGPAAANVINVQVDLVSKDDPFGQVRGGQLTIEAPFLAWTSPGSSHAGPFGGDGKLVNAIQNHIEMLLQTPDENFAAEYGIRHQPHDGQITAILWFHHTGHALLVESSTAHSPSYSASRIENVTDWLYHRIGILCVDKDIVSSEVGKENEDLYEVNQARDALYDPWFESLSKGRFVLV